MEYNFFADLLSTFRSVNDWTKALIILTLPTCLTACFIAWLHRRRKPAGKTSPGAGNNDHGGDHQYAAFSLLEKPVTPRDDGAVGKAFANKRLSR